MSKTPRASKQLPLLPQGSRKPLLRLFNIYGFGNTPYQIRFSVNNDNGDDDFGKPFVKKAQSYEHFPYGGGGFNPIL